MNAEEAQTISNSHLQMINSAFVLRINLKVKNSRSIVVEVSLEREIVASRIGNTHTVKKKKWPNIFCH